MIKRVIRSLRTPSSERLLLQFQEGVDGAALDVHYLPNGNVAGTLVILATAKVRGAAIPELLHEIDEQLLPDVSLNDRNLTFTVVVGDILGDYQSQLETRPPTMEISHK